MASEDAALNETIEHFFGEISRRVRVARRFMPHRTLVDATNYLRLWAAPLKRGDSF
jgi:hypothetical protein